MLQPHGKLMSHNKNKFISETCPIIHDQGRHWNKHYSDYTYQFKTYYFPWY